MIEMTEQKKEAFMVSVVKKDLYKKGTIIREVAAILRATGV